MRSKTFRLILAALLSFGRCAQAADRPLRDPRHILIKWNAASASAQSASMSPMGLKTISTLAHMGVQKLEIPEGVSPEEMVNRLRAQYGAQLAYAEVDHFYYAVHVPNDPDFPQQYHLPKIAAPGAWDTTTGAGVTIAICDTGIYGSHPDLAAHVMPGYNVAEENTDTTDTNGHGTAVAGTAAAVGDNAIDVTGVAYNATLMPVKIVVSSDSFTDEYTIASGIEYAADHGARVANLSFGSDQCDDSILLDAGSYMQAHNGIVVQAAGNSGLNRGCAPTAQITIVSATDENDQIAAFSNYGLEIAVSAPGVDIVTTGCPSGCLDTDLPNTAVESVDGTSFSSPIVSGVLALIFAVNPSFNGDQARSVLQSSADDLGQPGFDVYYGWGRVNAARALGAAQNLAQQLQLQSLSNIFAKPNPWDVRKTTAKGITIVNVPDGSTIKIFNIAGFFVKELTASSGNAVWDLTNDNGQNVASGLYLYYVKYGSNTFQGKVAVIR